MGVGCAAFCWIATNSRRRSAWDGANRRASCLRCLHVEAEVHDITLTDDVFLAFEAQLANFARAALTAVGDVVGIGDHFGTDEAALEIGVDHARSEERRVGKE